jgi:hypothetical protein
VSNAQSKSHSSSEEKLTQEVMNKAPYIFEGTVIEFNNFWLNKQPLGKCLIKVHKVFRGAITTDYVEMICQPDLEYGIEDTVTHQLIHGIIYDGEEYHKNQTGLFACRDLSGDFLRIPTKSNVPLLNQGLIFRYNFAPDGEAASCCTPVYGCKKFPMISDLYAYVKGLPNVAVKVIDTFNFQKKNYTPQKTNLLQRPKTITHHSNGLTINASGKTDTWTTMQMAFKNGVVTGTSSEKYLEFDVWMYPSDNNVRYVDELNLYISYSTDVFGTYSGSQSTTTCSSPFRVSGEYDYATISDYNSSTLLLNLKHQTNQNAEPINTIDGSIIFHVKMRMLEVGISQDIDFDETDRIRNQCTFFDIPNGSTYILNEIDYSNDYYSDLAGVPVIEDITYGADPLNSATSATGGTQDINSWVTIHGRYFGESVSNFGVKFHDANDPIPHNPGDPDPMYSLNNLSSAGGENDYSQEWSNSVITVSVPSRILGTFPDGHPVPGSGTIQVGNFLTDANTDPSKILFATSTSNVVIRYSSANSTNSQGQYREILADLPTPNNSYVVNVNTNIATSGVHAEAVQDIINALGQWSCQTGIAWQFGSVTNDQITFDNVSTIKIVPDATMGYGHIMTTIAHIASCSTEPVEDAFDIEISDKYKFDYSTNPSHDESFFEGILHELGHGIGLNHVIDASDLMRWSRANGAYIVSISPNDKEGADANITYSSTASVPYCVSNISTSVPSSCTIKSDPLYVTAQVSCLCPTPNVTKLLSGVQGGTPPYFFYWEPVTSGTDVDQAFIDNPFSATPTITGFGSAPGPTYIANYTLTVIDNSVEPMTMTVPIDVTLGPNQPAKLVMRDGTEDIFSEPNTLSENNFVHSPDIWVRNTNPSSTVHENPIYPGVGNHIYVDTRIWNIGCASSTGNDILRLYWTLASTGEKWDFNWKQSTGYTDGTTSTFSNYFKDPTGTLTSQFQGGEISSTSGITIPSIPGGQSTIIQTPWSPVRPQNLYTSYTEVGVCLLGRIETTTGDPWGMTYPEVFEVPYPTGFASRLVSKASTKTNVLNNNKVVTRNTWLSNLKGILAPDPIYVIVGNLSTSANVDIKILPNVQTSHGDFNQIGTIKVILGQILYTKWVNSGSNGTGFIANESDYSITISGPNGAILTGIPFDAYESEQIAFIPSLASNITYFEPGNYYYLISQYTSSDNALLGQYDIDLDVNDPNLPSNPVVNIQDLTSNLNKGNDNGILLFPNPTSGNILIQVRTDINQQVTFTLKDIAGRTIRSYSNIRNQDGLYQDMINVSDLTDGLYLLIATDEKGVVGQTKLIKQ